MGSESELSASTWGLTEYLVASVVLIFVYSWFNRKNKHGNLPPGPSPIPILGNLHLVKGSLFETFSGLRKTYGDIFTMHFGGYKAVILNSPKLIKEAFSEPALSARPSFLPAIQERGIGGVVFGDEGGWHEQRRFTLKTLKDFGFGKKSMESLVMEEVNELIDNFKKTTGKPIRTQTQFNAAVLNGLWQLVTGNRYSHDDPTMQKLVKLLTEAFQNSSPVLQFAPTFYYLINILPEKILGPRHRTEPRRNIRAFIYKAIKDHQESFQPDAVPRDFIDVYLAESLKPDSGATFQGEEGIRNLMLTMSDLFVAGAETTSTTLTWLFILLATNPDKQKKLQEEIDRVVGRSRQPSLNDRTEMPYTEAVIMEVMRYSSVAPTGVFHAAVKDTKLQGYDIPKDTIIIPNIFLCLHDPEIWGDPEKFKPERFLSADEKTVIRNEALIPFSTGKRVCLGETLARDELFLFTSSLCQRFRICPDPNGPPLQVKHHKGQVLSPERHELILYDRLEEES